MIICDLFPKNKKYKKMLGLKKPCKTLLTIHNNITLVFLLRCYLLFLHGY